LVNRVMGGTLPRYGRVVSDDVFLRRVRDVVLAAVVGVFLLLTFLWALDRLRGLLVLIVFSLF